MIRGYFVLLVILSLYLIMGIYILKDVSLTWKEKLGWIGFLILGFGVAWRMFVERDFKMENNNFISMNEIVIYLVCSTIIRIFMGHFGFVLSLYAIVLCSSIKK